MKILLLIFLLSYTLGFSQTKSTLAFSLNSKLQYANQLIFHYNNNIHHLIKYQDELMNWKGRELPKPIFTFIPLKIKPLGLQKFEEIDKLFNYQYNLQQLYIHISKFDSECRKIEKLNEKSSQKAFDEIFKSYQSIFFLSDLIVESSYDLSRSCAISFQKENYPLEILKIKDVCSQSKNLILALRNDNESQVLDYLALLKNSLHILNTTINIPEIIEVQSFDKALEVDEIKNIINNIKKQSNQVSNAGTKYLESSFSEIGLSKLLQEAIFNFNSSNFNSSIANEFNKLIRNKYHTHMIFLIEPNTLLAERIISKEINKTPSIKEEKPLVVKEKTSETITEFEIRETAIPIADKEKKIIEEVFDGTDNNSLLGALPNNLIILMDVSASMKKTQKLPILKETIQHVMDVMRDIDKLSMIAYSGKAKVLISGASRNDFLAINDTLKNLKSSGGSDLSNALKKAYKIGKENYIKKGNNKLIIASDGIFGITEEINKLVLEKTLERYSLSIFHYATVNENINNTNLKKLSKTGNGNYRKITNSQEAILSIMSEIKKESK